MAVFSGNGSAASPSFTFSSDTNLGIYRGGTDVLAFTTAGTERFTLNADGSASFAGIVDGLQFIANQTGGGVVASRNTDGLEVWRSGSTDFDIADTSTYTCFIMSDGSSFFEGTMGVGGTNASPNIELNADGSSVFKGSFMDISDGLYQSAGVGGTFIWGDNSSSSGGGFFVYKSTLDTANINSSALTVLSAADSSSTKTSRFQARADGSVVIGTDTSATATTNITLNADGKASFQGNIWTLDANLGSTNTTEGGVFIAGQDAYFAGGNVSVYKTTSADVKDGIGNDSFGNFAPSDPSDPTSDIEQNFVIRADGRLRIGADLENIDPLIQLSPDGTSYFSDTMGIGGTAASPNITLNENGIISNKALHLADDVTDTWFRAPVTLNSVNYAFATKDQTGTSVAGGGLWTAGVTKSGVLNMGDLGNGGTVRIALDGSDGSARFATDVEITNGTFTINPGSQAASIYFDRTGRWSCNTSVSGTNDNIGANSPNGGGMEVQITGDGTSGGLMKFSSYPVTASVGTAITLTERMRLDSDGALKIGGNPGLSPNIELRSSGSATFGEPLYTTNGFGVHLSGAGGNIYIQNSTATEKVFTGIHTDYANPHFYVTAEGTAQFGRFSTATTNNTHGGRFEQNSEYTKIIAQSSQFVASTASNLLELHRGRSAGGVDITTSFTVAGNGQMAGTLTQNASDIKFKDNIADAPSQSADIKALQLRTWDWNATAPGTESRKARHTMGLVAQEAALVDSDVTYTANEGAEDVDTQFQAIDHDVLTMKLLGALQEALTEIDDLKARLDAAGV